MLLKVLKAAAHTLVSRSGRAPDSFSEYPLEIEQKLNRVHARAGLDRHLAILFGQERIGDDPFVELYMRCLVRTGTAVTPFNTLQRFQTRLDLMRYFLA